MIEALNFQKAILSSELIILGLFEGEKSSQALNALDKELGQFASEILKKENFKGKAGTSLSFYYNKDKKLIQILITGLGKNKDWAIDTLREAVGKSVLEARRKKIKQTSLLLKSFTSGKAPLRLIAEAAAEASGLALYIFKNYKKSDEDGASKYPEKIYLVYQEVKQLKEIQSGIRSGSFIADGVKTARDFANEPSNKMSPEIFAKRTIEAGKEAGFRVKVLEKKDLAQEKMGALLAVGQGSRNAPKLLVLNYDGRKQGAPICLVGKGVTFDSGGINLKPSKGMEKMKYDMAGASSVVGTFVSVAHLKLPVKLVGIVPLAENMPGGGAVKPGDVIDSASGLSIEVVNTDAEGRLILADALHYAKKFKPKAVYDLATLTGAAIVALGTRCTAVLGDSVLIDRLQKAGKRVNERVWELPMYKEYEDDIQSAVADVKNVGAGEAGTIIGAKFLEKFVNKSYPWVHLDIAGTAWVDKKVPSYCPKGARGIGVRLLIELLRTKC